MSTPDLTVQTPSALSTRVQLRPVTGPDPAYAGGHSRYGWTP